MQTSETLWTFEYDGERQDYECTTKKGIKLLADEWWEIRHEDEEMKNGETREDECFIINFKYDDEGEFVELSRQRHMLCYEYYHGDFKEHNTYGL